jgi:hypothetical protein
VTKRLVDIDNGALDAARAQMGTATIKNTVNEAHRRAAGSREATVVVLHYDANFDLIAQATGHPFTWVVAAREID